MRRGGKVRGRRGRGSRRVGETGRGAGGVNRVSGGDLYKMKSITNNGMFKKNEKITR